MAAEDVQRSQAPFCLIRRIEDCEVRHVKQRFATPFADWSRSLQRLQLAEHGRDQFCDSRMNVHGALNHRVWRLGVHHVQEGVNYLIALDPQERRSKDLFRFGIHQNFHESVRLAFPPRTAVNVEILSQPALSAISLQMRSSTRSLPSRVNESAQVLKFRNEKKRSSNHEF